MKINARAKIRKAAGVAGREPKQEHAILKQEAGAVGALAV